MKPVSGRAAHPARRAADRRTMPPADRLGRARKLFIRDLLEGRPAPFNLPSRWYYTGAGKKVLKRETLLPVLLFVWLAAGCAQPASRSASFVAFDTAEVVIRSEADSAVLLVEVASTFEQKSLGLSRRPRLDRNSGMLFRYDSVGAEGDGFWMWRTRMPLVIAFIDTTWVIAEV